MDLFTIEQPFMFGAARYEGGGRYGPVRHPHLDVGYLASGTAQVSADGVQFEAEAGYATLIYTERSLEVAFPAGSVQEVMWCHTGLVLAPRQSIAQLRTVAGRVRPSALLLTLLDAGHGLGCARDPATNRVRNTLGASAVLEYLRLAGVGGDRAPLPGRLDRVKAYIDAEFTGEADFSLAHLARLSALSPNHLLESFRHHLGKTPRQYLWGLRLARGVKLLLTTDLPVGVIAFRSGFKCPHHFARLLSRHYGSSPSALRRDRWANDPALAAARQVPASTPVPPPVRPLLPAQDATASATWVADSRWCR